MQTRLKTIWYVLGVAIETCVNGAASRIEIEECEKCGGNMKVIASIEEPDVIADASDRSILIHLGLNEETEPHNRSPPTQSSGLFDQTIALI